MIAQSLSQGLKVHFQLREDRIQNLCQCSLGWLRGAGAARVRVVVFFKYKPASHNPVRHVTDGPALLCSIRAFFLSRMGTFASTCRWLLRRKAVLFCCLVVVTDGATGSCGARDGVCAACPEGLSCSDWGAGVAFTDLRVKPGYWRSHARSARVRSCPWAEACAGRNSSGDASCSPGYQGPLCSVCSPGWVPRLHGTFACTSCSPAYLRLLRIASLITFVLALWFWLLWRVRGPLALEWLQDRMGLEGEEKLLRAKHKLRVLGNLLHLVCAIPAAAPDLSLPPVFLRLTHVGQLISLNLPALLTSGCAVPLGLAGPGGGLRYRPALAAAAFWPVVALCALGLARKRGGPGAARAPKLAGYAWLVLWASAPHAFAVALQGLRGCDGDFDGENERYLPSDYTTTCDTPAHTAGRSAAWGVLASVGLGLPLLLLSCLRRARRWVAPRLDENLRKQLAEQEFLTSYTTYLMLAQVGGWVGG